MAGGSDREIMPAAAYTHGENNTASPLIGGP